MRSVLIGLSVTVFCLGTVAADAIAKGKEKGEAFLVRTEPAVDDDARGRVRTQQGKNDEEVRFDCKKLDPAGSFEVFMEDSVGSATFVSFGAMVADDDAGEFKLRVRAKDGPLPLGATSVDDYADRAVEIRSGGTTAVLVGVMPSTEKIKGKKGFEKEKVALDLPVTPPDPDAKGRVELWEKIKDGRHRFRVKAERLSASDTYTVFVEDAVGSNTFVEVLDMKKSGGKGEKSEFKLYLDAANGDPLPAGATTVADLADRLVQVRNATDEVVLEGTLPSLQ